LAAVQAANEKIIADQDNATSAENNTAEAINTLTAERNRIAQELATIRTEHGQIIADQEAQTLAEASAAEAIDNLTGRVTRLADVLDSRPLKGIPIRAEM
jgi:hypothetical protein